jgi:SAM-dependent methyltransferase
VDHFTCDPLADYFTEEARVQSRLHGQWSTLEWWDWLRRRDPAWLVRTAQRLVLTRVRVRPLVRDWPAFLLREALWEVGVECTQFKVSLAKGVWDFCLRHTGKAPGEARLLDPCAGWGERLLGAMALDCRAYVGVDPNPAVHPGYREAVSRLPSATRVELHCVPFEDFAFAEASYDVVFTSPPYGHFEYYYARGAEEAQCNVRYDRDTWVEAWLLPQVSRMWRAVAPGGCLALHLDDSRHDAPYCRRVFGVLEQLGAGAPLPAQCIRGDRRRPLWLWLREQEAARQG